METLIKGDCLIEMQNIPDKSIDLILCDLPYGTTKCYWDVIIPFDKLWEQYERIIKSDGVVVLLHAARQQTTKSDKTVFFIYYGFCLCFYKHIQFYEKIKAVSF